MNAAFANPDDTPFKPFFVYSLLFHASLAIVVVVSAFLQHRGNPWGTVGGGGSGSVRVNLVGALAGIPMPNPSVVTDSRTVDPTKGLYKEEPKPKQPEPPTDAKKIPQFEKEKRPKPIVHPSRTFDRTTPTPDNAVPYGKGGVPEIPTGGGLEAPGTGGGIGMQGQGGGDFGARYPWYVEATTRRVDSNWDRLSIDPAARANRSLHCAVTFTIFRDGTIRDARVSEASGNASFDNSGLRAVLNSDPMPRLPADYSGTYITVTLDFPRK